jgi:hypothetical protein
MVQGRWAEGSGFGGVLSIVDTEGVLGIVLGFGIGYLLIVFVGTPTSLKIKLKT